MFRHSRTIYTNTLFYILFISGGLIPYDSGSDVYEYLMSGLECLSIFMIFLGFLHPILSAQTVEEKCYVFAATYAIFANLHKHWTIKCYRRPLQKFVDNIRNMRPNLDGREAATEVEMRFRKFSIRILITFCAGYLCVIFYILLAPYFAEFDYRKSNYYVIRGWFSCSNFVKHTTFGQLLPCWYFNSYAKFVTINLIVVFIWIFQQAINISTLLLFTYIRQYLEAHENVIRSRLNKLGQKIMRTNEGSDSTSRTLRNNQQKWTEFELQKDLKNIIRYYQFFHG